MTLYRAIANLAVILACVLLYALSPAANAQPTQARPPVSLGVGVVASPAPYAGVDEQPVTTVPFVNMEGERFYLRGVEAGYQLWAPDSITLSAIVQPRFQSFSAEDSNALAGMADRRRTLEGGLRINWRRGPFQAELRTLTDLLDRHQGHSVTTDAGMRLGGRRLSVTPSAGVTWRSRDFVRYYYGVRPGEARPTRPSYAGATALNPFIGANARIQLTGRWGLFTFLRHTWLDSAITDSPIVDTTTNMSGGFAVTVGLGGGPE